MNQLPNELLLLILTNLATQDPKSLLSVSYSCRKIYYLLQRYPETFRLAATRIYPSITLASCENDIPALLLFIKAKVDVDEQDDAGQTCLHKSAQWGFLTQLRILISVGYRLDIPDVQSKTPLIVATQSNHELIVEELIKLGANVHYVPKDGKNVLVYAVWNGNMKLVRVFLDCGVDVNQVIDNGETSLLFACQKGNLSIISYLLDRGANVHNSVRNGWTILHQAVEQGNISVCRLLLERGADVNRVDGYGISPLFVAIARYPNPELVELLLSYQASINCQTNSGITPLMKAVMNRNTFMVELLLKNGADPTLKNRDGHVCLFIAKKLGLNRMTALLEV